MNEMILPTALSFRIRPKQRIELSPGEYAALTIIIDLLIPADENFPPPSSLHLIDEFLQHLKAASSQRNTFYISEQRLRKALRDVNLGTPGGFCLAHPEQQQSILLQLEQRDPAFFQALWTLASHSYYARLADQHPSPINQQA